MRNLKIAFFLMIVPVFAILSALKVQEKPLPKLDLYILMGQSNMAGRGVITPDIAEEHNVRVYMFTKDQQWILAKHPLHFDKPSVAGVGPGLTFGIKMAEADPKATIGLIPCAVGGTSIERWLPGAYDPSTKTHPYDDAVERITEAMKYGTIKGVIWHQGESNSSAERSKMYLEKLTALINRVRLLVGNPKLPFIVGELGRYRPIYQNINSELAKLPTTVPYTALVSSDGLVHKGDTTHFDGPSAQELGKRFAAGMLKVQKELKEKSSRKR